MNFECTPIFKTDFTDVSCAVCYRHELLIGFKFGMLSKYSIRKKVHRDAKVLNE
jgi:hypothetical protein